jgi:hypothetical protein
MLDRITEAKEAAQRLLLHPIPASPSFAAAGLIGKKSPTGWSPCTELLAFPNKQPKTPMTRIVVYAHRYRRPPKKKAKTADSAPQRSCARRS